jgi:hypothetical protein
LCFEDLSLRVSNFGGLEHELGDVREESALAEVYFLEGDSGEKLREDLVDVRRGLEVGGARGESGGKAIGFGGLLHESGVVGTERRMRGGEGHATTAVQGIEMGAAGIGTGVESGFRHLGPRKMVAGDDVKEVEEVEEVKERRP